MYFKRVEMFGFKSFAEKTTLEFQPGITAVVGPNGCGKSNVFDAIRWVLGEQSAKDLRGSSMEDVIFSGTDTRPSLGFSEVSVTFSNERKLLPIATDEVTVTRRLFRSGESEYLLNKDVCRLKDIVELFLGTGVGSDAYSFVQQGRVDLVVSAKPDDRRQIFDEAAGITKYKAKKKEALSKLKETEDNLLRINDIVVEVKRQIATIERQAKKAQRYKEEFEQLKSMEWVLARQELERFRFDLAQIAEASTALAAQETELTAQLREYHERLDHETALIEELEEEINALKAKQMRLENDADINTRQIAFNEERLGNIDAANAQLEQDKAAALERCKTNQVKMEEIKAALAGLTNTIGAVKARLCQQRDHLSSLVHGIEEALQSIKTYTQEQFALNAQEVRAKNQLTDHMRRHLELVGRRGRLEQDSTKVSGEKTQVHQKFETINSAIGRVNTDVQAAWEDLNNQRYLLEQAQLRLSSQENAVGDLEKSRVFLVSQKEFIAKVEWRGPGENTPASQDPVVEGRFLSAVRPSEKQTGIIGKIKDIQEVPGANPAVPMYEITYETKYIELDLGEMDAQIAQIDVGLGKAIEEEQRCRNLLWVQQQAVDAVLKRIQEFEKKLSVLESQKNDIELETGKITGELSMIVTESAQVSADLAALTVQEIQLNETLLGISGQIKRCQEDIKAKQDTIAAKNQEREQFNVGLVQLEGEVQAAADKQKSLEDSLAIYVQSLDRDLTDISRCELLAQESLAKKAAINEDSVRLNGQIEALRNSIKEMAIHAQDQVQRKDEMSQRLGSLRHQSRAVEEQIIDLKTLRHNFDLRQQELAFNQRSLKERLQQTYRIDLDQPMENDPSAEGGPVAQGGQEQQAGTGSAPQVNVEELRVEIKRLKQRCESYGAVNLVAIEEFEELKQRFEFLTQQQSDLLTARESLLSTIQKINRTTRQMFTDTFTRVNEEFQIYFRMLFGGGSAQLILLDPEDALESGIDIVARPPGKQPQQISLLSGGEKTLTAIALIFGVFKVNPSPFCVLDEIDAALDESNVGRFAVLLKEFAKISQFIVITHNKKTMESADILYGVTMPERGVSRIVSVNFNKKSPQVNLASVPAQPAVDKVLQPH